MTTIQDPRWSGWRLTLIVSLILLAVSASIGLAAPDHVDGARHVIHLTARTSLGLFALAFTASSLHRLFAGPATAWLLRNRRYVGVSFAVSHAIHAVAVIALATLSPPTFHHLTNTVTYIGGGLAYVFIILMTITSFDRPAAALGPRAWRWLHLVGAWYIWLSFLLNFGKRAVMDSMYWPAMLVVLAMLVLRLSAMRPSRRLAREPG